MNNLGRLDIRRRILSSKAAQFFYFGTSCPIFHTGSRFSGVPFYRPISTITFFGRSACPKTPLHLTFIQTLVPTAEASQLLNTPSAFAPIHTRTRVCDSSIRVYFSASEPSCIFTKFTAVERHIKLRTLCTALRDPRCIFSQQRWPRFCSAGGFERKISDC